MNKTPNVTTLRKWITEGNISPEHRAELLQALQSADTEEKRADLERRFKLAKLDASGKDYQTKEPGFKTK